MIDFVYVGDIAELMNVDRKTIYRWVKQNKLPNPSTFGGKTFRWERRVINDWVAEGLRNSERVINEPVSADNTERETNGPGDQQNGGGESPQVGANECPYDEGGWSSQNKTGTDGGGDSPFG
tara:strand:+ start:173 stop:538 length:366 start_codon:yes stop_codon:yes gene_type:complete